MNLLPKPKKLEKKQGIFEISWHTVITVDESIRENGTTYAAVLQTCIRKYTGIESTFIKGKQRAGDIFLTMEPENYFPQGYHIAITPEGLTIAGGDGAAVLYGVQTLCQMIAQCGGVLECVDIDDAPDIQRRGYFLDETRGRVLSLPYLKGIADRLSRYKINEFQLYVEHTYLFRDLTELWRDETPLTAEDIIELDAYCRKRHIELVPALASFGHLYKLLSTRSYGDLCERSNPWNADFSFWDRMAQHTIDTTDGRALPLIKNMLAEYGALFTSDKFNICADETFDLGCEKSRGTAERIGKDQMYINHVKELCDFLHSYGKRVQFFGDIICRKPELIARLPQDTLCLTWGYAPEQSVDSCHAMAQAGAVQYLCPGVSGWNQWMNRIKDSYSNILKMCGYAHQYHAEGVLNTDWGDFGHINHPAFSVPGMIYGAAFSWNQEDIAFDEISRQISMLEYGDTTGQTVGILSEVPEHSLFGWRDAVVYYEKTAREREFENGEEDPPQLLLADADTADGMVEQADKALRELSIQMKRTAAYMDAQARDIVGLFDLTVEAVRIWNEVGAAVVHEKQGVLQCQEKAYALAGRIERWFMAFKGQWRSIGREGDLQHIAEIVFWYADRLRRK
ncbi:MAG: beta-N-acetylhexosaminidase [Lachnospiraceae bacterium]|nr:beta-N-acetylhexosaminidase [Lachnospiraceae bacterium]